MAANSENINKPQSKAHKKTAPRASATPIHDFLAANKKRGNVRCHMPGHKGYENPFDITEISGADSLYESDDFSKAPGIIAQSEINATRLFGTRKTLYSCGGSTLAIQTMLSLAKQGGKQRDHVIAGRYSHRSFISSCVLLGLIPSWVYPESYLGCDVSPFDVEAAINEKTLCVFINSIDYYGRMGNISALSDVCKKHGIPLLVDNAFGAYLKFAPYDVHPITLGADMCADSAHKTLPVLTGGAYLHISDERYCDGAKHTMALFGSSSPSYLILDSLDKCNKMLMKNPDHIKNLCAKASILKNELSAMGYALCATDSMHITFDCQAIGSAGYIMADGIASLGIECEYADQYKCVLLLGYDTTDADLFTIREVFSRCTPAAFRRGERPAPAMTIKTMSAATPTDAFFSVKQRIPLKQAVGKICAEILAPCPPGIPLVMPGEVLTPPAVAALAALGVEYVSISL